MIRSFLIIHCICLPCLLSVNYVINQIPDNENKTENHLAALHVPEMYSLSYFVPVRRENIKYFFYTNNFFVYRG